MNNNRIKSNLVALTISLTFSCGVMAQQEGVVSNKNDVTIQDSKEPETEASMGMQIFPNPVVRDAVIQMRDKRKTVISANIYDMGGKLVRYYPNVMANKFIISRDNMGPGIYMMMVLLENGDSVAGKVVVK